MVYTNIILHDITCIEDFKVPLQVTFGIYLEKFEKIWIWIRANDLD
jgi:hypothetical protein